MLGRKTYYRPIGTKSSNPQHYEPVADPTRKVEIGFKLKYVSCDLAPESVENKPVVELFFSRHFIRDPATGGEVVIHLDEHDLSKEYEGKLVATLDRAHAGISRTAAIGVASYAVHFNEYSHPCYVNCGTNHALLGNVFDEVASKGEYKHNLDLLMRTVVISGLDPVKKGTIELTIHSIDVAPGVKMLPVGSSVLEAAVSDDLNSYINKCMELEQSIPDTLSGMGSIRAPMDISQSGIELTETAFLPVASFAMVEPPKVNVGYFKNALQQTMKMNGRRMAHYHDFNIKEKCRTLGQVMGFLILFTDYIGDSIELNSRKAQFVQRMKEGTEEFSQLSATLAGDCEDGGNSEAALFRAFLGLQIPDTEPELRDLQQHARDGYKTFQALTAVKGAQIKDQVTERGAHMYLPMLTTKQVADALERTSAGRKLAVLHEDKAPPQGIFGDVAQKKAADPYPHLTIEGTGPLDPIGFTLDNPIYLRSRYIAQQMTSAQSLKKRIFNLEGKPSGFYECIVFGATDEYINMGVNIGGFIMGTVAKNKHGMTRGILYEDLINKSNKLAIMPYPRMPDKLVSICKEANALRPPPRPLIFDPNKPLAGPKTNPDLDRFVEAVRGYGRTKPTQVGLPVDLYLRPHHFNAAKVDDMIADACRMHALYDASYEVMHLTNNIYAYRVSLFVDETKVGK